MRVVAGYAFGELLYESAGFLFYAVQRSTTGEQLIAKVSSREFPALADMQALEDEVRLLRNWPDDVPGILKPVQRIDDNRNSYVIYQFFPGVPLAAFAGSTWQTGEALELAAALLGALRNCHSRGVLHGNLAPGNILWDKESRSLRLTQFASPFSERPEPPSSLSAFSAPEQTGHVNAAADGRSDLYSAGAVLYWALTGSAPVDEGQQTSFIA